MAALPSDYWWGGGGGAGTAGASVIKILKRFIGVGRDGVSTNFYGNQVESFAGGGGVEVAEFYFLELVVLEAVETTAIDMGLLILVLVELELLI